MKDMSLQQIAEACKGTFRGNSRLLDRCVSGVTIDSRKIRENDLFIPLKGERVDGHDFISQVMEHGALCTLTQKDLGQTDFPYIWVEDCKQAMKMLAEHYRQALGIPVIGITGSVGKTSTKEMIASILSQKYHVLKTEGNFNNAIGLPLTIFNIRKEHEIVVLEMGISDFGEMHRLSKMAKPDVCVITNIGLCHLENLGDRDGILRAKSEIFDFLKEDGIIILNGDDDKLCTIREKQGIHPLFFGLSKERDCFATDISPHSLRGISCTIHLQDDEIRMLIPIPGEHMVYNALAGALIGQHFGLTPSEIKAGIESLVPVSGRNNLIETDSFLLIDDCYNANPISMRSSVDVLSTADTRKVAILGDMFELGEDENALHEGVGVYVAQKNIDILVTIGDLSENINHGCLSVKETAVRAVHFPTKAAFLDVADTILKKGDTILIKASHGMEFTELTQKLREISMPTS